MPDVNIKRWLEGFGPKPSEWLAVQFEIPRHLWPVALALCDAGPAEDDPEMYCGDFPIAEAKARALARTMGLLLPDAHDWFVGTTAAE